MSWLCSDEDYDPTLLTPPELPASLLTPEERDLLEDLGVAWNKFHALRPLHPNERQEFAAAIHAAQYLVMARPVRRELEEELQAIHK